MQWTNDLIQHLRSSDAVLRPVSLYLAHQRRASRTSLLQGEPVTRVLRHLFRLLPSHHGRLKTHLRRTAGVASLPTGVKTTIPHNLWRPQAGHLMLIRFRENSAHDIALHLDYSRQNHSIVLFLNLSQLLFHLLPIILCLRLKDPAPCLCHCLFRLLRGSNQGISY